MLIKMFEEFSDQLFKETNRSEFISMLSAKHDSIISFDDKEMEELSKFGNIDKDYYDMLSTQNWMSFIVFLIVNIYPTPRYDLQLFKLLDEWYYVTVNNEFYKCDGWEGLISCLNHIKKNYTKTSYDKVI